MHESSIAKRVLSVVLDRARAERASRVLAVRGRVAESEGLSNESLSFHFAAHARGTIAEGAELKLDVSPVYVRCDDCGADYVPEHHVRLCPHCSCSDGRLTGEEGVWIEDLDVR